MLHPLDVNAVRLRGSQDSGDLFKDLRQWWRGKSCLDRATAGTQLDEETRRCIFDLLIEVRKRKLYKRQADEVLLSLAASEEWTANEVLDISSVDGLRAAGVSMPVQDAVNPMLKRTSRRDLSVPADDGTAADNRDRIDSMDPAPPLTTQFLFFVRHAESRWNNCQSKRNITGMYSERDHGITDNGREQAENLRASISSAVSGHSEARDEEREWRARFLDPGVIFVSPLTRAIQTAVLALRELLADSRRELVCMRLAREKKNLGGHDTRGVAMGEDIQARVQAELLSLYDRTDSPCFGRTLMPTLMEGVKLNVGEVEEHWWDSLPESDVAFGRRLVEFAQQIHDTGEENVIVVGHSHFIQQFFREFSPDANAENDGEASKRSSIFSRISNVTKRSSASSRSPFCNTLDLLKVKKLPNCGVVGLRLLWTPHGNAVIEEAMLLFGTDCDGIS